MPYALILDGTVAQISAAEFPVNDRLSWVEIPENSDVSTGYTYAGGKFVAPSTPEISLSDRAAFVLTTARTYVSNNYTMLNEATPDVWVAYLKALMAIANGNDTTSTALPSEPTASTSYTLTGAATATAGTAVTLTITPDNSGPDTATTVTLSDGDAGGTFSPTAVTLAAWDATAQTVTYTPKAAGTVSISATNSGVLTNPAALSVVVSAAG